MTDWYISCYEDGIQPSSVCLYHRVLKSFTQWRHKNCGADDYMADVARPRVPRKIRMPLTHDQVRAVTRYFSDDKWNHAAYRAMFLWMYSTGCRVAETIGLDLDAVDWEKMTVTVTGKGNKQRVLPIPKECAQHLRFYLTGHRVDGCDALFTNRDGRRFTAKMVQKVFTKAGNALDIHLHPHRVRRTYATTMYENGANLYTIKDLLGHDSVQTTAMYLGLSDRHKHETVAEYLTPVGLVH